MINDNRTIVTIYYNKSYINGVYSPSPLPLSGCQKNSHVIRGLEHPVPPLTWSGRGKRLEFEFSCQWIANDLANHDYVIKKTRRTATWSFFFFFQRASMRRNQNACTCHPSGKQKLLPWGPHCVYLVVDSYSLTVFEVSW